MKSIFKSWNKGAALITDAGWGDSGKGKCVSFLTPNVGAKIIGGHNAGHTVVTKKGEFGLGLVPSTIIRGIKVNVIGPEVVINPIFLANEIEGLISSGIKITPKNLIIDPRSHIILRWHEIRDALSEEARGKGAIGSLHLGVGWAYSDRVNRRGLRLGDLLSKDWKKRIKDELKVQDGVIEDMARDVKRKTGRVSKVKRNIVAKELIALLEKPRRILSNYQGNGIETVWRALDTNKKVLFEDSHGAMLEVSHGSWPFTTGVNTALGAVHRSFGGKAVKETKKIIVVVKAYQTRVGGGPMPTEDFGAFGDYVREKGGERGTRSKRPRRCGAIDLPLLKYGLNVIGAGKTDEIALTKLDIFSGVKKIPVCTAYKHKGKTYKTPPSVEASFLSEVKPKLIYLPGWEEDISSVRKLKNLPKEAQKYVLFLEKELGVKITFIGVGKEYDAVILP